MDVLIFISVVIEMLFLENHVFQFLGYRMNDKFTLLTKVTKIYIGNMYMYKLGLKSEAL